jgi:nitrite reductase/ring-hydroxylating ferredoxin subunit
MSTHERSDRRESAHGGRAHPPDPDLVAERITRLTTDARVTRRGYLRILGILSGGLALGNVAVAAGAFRRRTEGATVEIVIANDASSIPVGGAVRFTYPTERDPAVLLRLDDDLFVAYSTICTHLACEVLWRAEHDDLFCPCHDGHFSPENGEPTAGPPIRPLPGILLEERDGAIVAVGEAPITREAADAR